MTSSDFSSKKELRFFISTPAACGYVKGRESVSLFADPKYSFTPALYDILIDHGFRRSSDYIYRPHCPSCSSCTPVRIPVDQFSPNKNQKRVWKKNQDLQVVSLDMMLKEEHFQLYKKYQLHRHGEGEMASHNIDRYTEFLASDWCDTRLFEFRLNQKLVAVAVTDVVRRGISAFYTFFDPDFSKRSLGSYAILWQIQEAKRMRLPWLYLGYWIQECQKMNYKTQFQPLELRVDDQWIAIDKQQSAKPQ